MKQGRPKGRVIFAKRTDADKVTLVAKRIKAGNTLAQASEILGDMFTHFTADDNIRIKNHVEIADGQSKNIEIFIPDGMERRISGFQLLEEILHDYTSLILQSSRGTILT